VADDRLYQLKHANHTQRGEATPPAPPTHPPEMPAGPAAAAGAARETPAPAPTPVQPPAERRKWERVSLAGTRAYALLGEAPEKTAHVLDLGYGGVALQTDAPEELAASFHAVLHVPILPPVRVSLRRVYLRRGQGTTARVGCSFVS